MKQLLMLGIIIVVGSTTIVLGQEGRGGTPSAQVETRAKVIAELTAAAGGQSVKGLPFSADEVSESVQTLADGNRITRSSTGKIYRNSEGRIRREHSGGAGGMMGSFYMTSPAISILSPTEGHKYLLDAHEKTARVIELEQGQKELVIAQAAKAASEADQVRQNIELRTKIESDVRVREPMIVTGQGTGFATTVIGSGESSTFAATGVGSRYETKSESLGTRDFEGVSAEGTKRVTIIPAGAIGNELPIETTYERWYSKELGMVVYSKNADPRFGEQTYKLTNITRAEPDPSLFNVPTEYKRISEPGSVYKISSAKPMKAATSPKTVTVVNTVTSTKP
jgi:hypothetical protein